MESKMLKRTVLMYVNHDGKWWQAKHANEEVHGPGLDVKWGCWWLIADVSKTATTGHNPLIIQIIAL